MGLAGLGEGHGQERRARSQEGHSCRRGTCKINRLRGGHEFHGGHAEFEMAEGQPEMFSKQIVG